MELKRYWKIICLRKWILLQAIFVIMGVAVIGSFALSPIYKTSAVVLFKTRDFQASFFPDLPREFGKHEFFDPKNAISSYQGLLKSKPFIEKVVKDLNLKDGRDRLIESKDFIVSTMRLPKLLLMTKKGVEIRQQGSTEVLEIIGYSTQPAEALSIANKTLDTFSEAFTDISRDGAKKAQKAIEKSIPNAKEILSAAETAQMDFMAKEKLADAGEQTKVFITQLSSLEDESTKTARLLQENNAALNKIKESLKTQPEFRDSKTSTEANPLINSYKNQLITLTMNLEKLKTDLTEDHPAVKSVLNQINAVKDALKGELAQKFASQESTRNSYYDSLVERHSNTEIDVVLLTLRQKILNAKISDVNKNISAMAKKQIELSRLQKDVDTYRTVYASLLRQLEMAKIAQTIEVSNVMQVHPAGLSFNIKNDIYFPRKKLIFLISLFTGIATGLFLVFLFEYLDDSVKTPDDAKKLLNQPLLGVIKLVPQKNIKDTSDYAK